MTCIALLFGGRSGEHEVSLRSAATIANHLDRNKYSLEYIGIDKEGVWYSLDEADARGGVAEGGKLHIEPREAKIISAVPGKGLFVGETRLEVDIVFPVLHGTFGEDGTMQGFCEILGLPYVGSDVIGSAIGIDKEKAKRLWSESGLPIVPYMTVTRQNLEGKDFRSGAVAEKIKETLGFPVFVKPTCTGSSVGVTKVKRPEELGGALSLALNYDNRLLIEQAIDGRELECSVIGNSAPRAFPPGEILPSHEFYDYEAKYVDENGAVCQIPADLDESVQREIESLAVKAYLAAGVEGFARVDFFLEEGTGSLYINEINTIPGFTSISMFPKMCINGGLNLEELLDELILLGRERWGMKNDLTFSYDSTSTSG